MRPPLLLWAICSSVSCVPVFHWQCFSKRDKESEVQMNSKVAIAVCSGRRVGCKTVEGHHLQKKD